MDAPRLAMQVGRPGEVDVIGGAEPASHAARIPTMMVLRDFRRDWRRWGAAERVCAAALGGLWAAGLTAAILGGVHLV